METKWTDTSLEYRWRRHSKERSQNWLYHVLHPGRACIFQKWKPLIPVPEFREWNLFLFLPVPQFAISHICMEIQSKLKDPWKVNVAAVQVLFTTFNYYNPWVQWEWDNNGNSQMTSGRGRFRQFKIYIGTGLCRHTRHNQSQFTTTLLSPLISCQQNTKILNHKTWLL